jgi:hypothetical protein
MSQVLNRCQHHLELQVITVSTVHTSLLLMMTCCATARWKLPTETSVYGDIQWLFLIRFPPIISCNTRFEALTDQLRCIVSRQVSCRFFPHLLVRSIFPPLANPACTMMIRHWAPTIRDGYAYSWQASETSPTDTRALHGALEMILGRTLLTSSQ